MEIEYKGANCIVISTKQVSVVIDPKLSLVGLKDAVPNDSLELLTDPDFRVEGGQKLIIDGPGEYEVGNISIRGIAAKKKIGDQSKNEVTLYRLESPDVRMAILGHTSAPLTDEQLEELSIIDLLIIPVGGGGYTLDAHEATVITRQIDPKVVIPTHYADKNLKYEVDQNEIDAFTKELAVSSEVMPKLKIKGGLISDALSIVQLSRSDVK